MLSSWFNRLYQEMRYPSYDFDFEDATSKLPD